MKTIFNTFLVVASMVLLYSCSSSKQTAFAKRKYTHFKHGDVQVALNKPETKERKSNYSTYLTVNENTEALVSSKTDIRNESDSKKNSFTAPVKQKKTSSAVRKNDLKNKTQKSTTTFVSAKEDDSDLNNEKTYEDPFKSTINQVGLIFLAIFLPPLAVYKKERGKTKKFWIDLLLTVLLFWVPGVIFAMLVIYGVVK